MFSPAEQHKILTSAVEKLNMAETQRLRPHPFIQNVAGVGQQLDVASEEEERLDSDIQSEDDERFETVDWETKKADPGES